MGGRAVFVIVVLAFLGALVSGVPLLVKAAYALAILALLSYAWGRLNLMRLRAVVTPATDRCQVGQLFQEEVTLRNTGPWPKVLLEVEGSQDVGPTQGNVVSLLSGHSLTWRPRTKCQLRGIYQVGMVTVRSNDPWGFFRRSRRLGSPRSLLVYPATVDLPNFRLPTMESLGEGRKSGLAIEVPPTFSSLRDYVPGDSFSRVHWPTTARLGKLMVKDFKVHPAGEVWVILDLQETAQAGQGAESTEEYGVTIAASLARQLLEANYSVGLLAQGDRPLALNPQRGQHNLWLMLEALALIRAKGRLPLGQLLVQKAEGFGSQSSLVVITSGGLGLEAALFRHGLRQRNRVAVVVLEAASFGGKGDTLARRLGAAGVETYLVRRGDDISKALDSRVTSAARVVEVEA